MEHPDFNEALHPRDEKGRWAAKVAAAIKSAGNSQAGQAVAHHYRAKAQAAKLTAHVALAHFGGKLIGGSFRHAGRYMGSPAVKEALGAGIATAAVAGLGGHLVKKHTIGAIKTISSNGTEKRGLAPKIVTSPPSTLGHKGKNTKTQAKK